MPQRKHHPPCKAHTIFSQMLRDEKIDQATKYYKSRLLVSPRIFQVYHAGLLQQLQAA
jgi:hypothetical protein